MEREREKERTDW